MAKRESAANLVETIPRLNGVNNVKHHQLILLNNKAPLGEIEYLH